MDEKKIIIKPQEGFQEAFLSSPADILIGGGAAGAGKSYALLMDPLRYKNIPGFGAVIFRRTTPQIRNEGGLIDTSTEFYPLIGGEWTDLQWTFRIPDNIRGSRVRFRHMEYEKNMYDHQGAQYPFIGFDELTQFTKKQFFYLLGRNRSPIANVKPCIRATCNPDPDSWVAEFLEWWIDQETGFPIPERSGVLRYFTVDADQYVWGDSYQEVIDRCPHIFDNPKLKNVDPQHLIKSVTFIPGDVYENKELMKKDPAYLGNLLAQSEEEQLRLLHGNWKIRTDGTSIFNYVKIRDLFSNFVEDNDSKCIICDVARFGSNLAVIHVWQGWEIVKILIFTKSKTTTITNAIEREREAYKISTSRVLIDQDGVGGGVVDEGGYVGFSGGTPAVEDPNTEIKENYKNLKTQCCYRMGNRANAGKIRINLNEVYVDGVRTDVVKIGKKEYSVKQLIIDDLRVYKRKDPDKEGKLEINSKEEQKNALGGRSPDNGDAFIMREYFELNDDSVFFSVI